MRDVIMSGATWGLSVPWSWCVAHGMRDETDAADNIQQCALEELEEVMQNEDIGPLDVAVTITYEGDFPTHSFEFEDKSRPPLYQQPERRRLVERAFEALINDFKKPK